MKKNKFCLFLSFLVLCSCEVAKYKYYDEENYTVLQAHSEKDSISIENVKNIDIDWLDGVVYFKSSNDVSSIQIYEDFYDYKPVKNEYARYSEEENTLDIKFTKSNITIIDDLEKDLYVIVPSSYSLDSVYINSKGSKIDIESIVIENLKIAQVSGNNKIKSISSTIDIKTVSSNTEIYLNANDGFTSSFDTVSGKFNSELAVILKDGVSTYTSSTNRTCNITCKTTSGNLDIKKND